jgi:isopentenyl-diphosphate delta-isomerase
MDAQNVILVDHLDNQIGLMEKMQVHQRGLLHRAFSVFVFNEKGELLLQKRAMGKYHSPGLWTNTCCSHPSLGEDNLTAANRRLQEEMGMQCTLSKAFDFIYHAHLENNLIEHEFDHVYFGRSNANPQVNTEEVCDWKWMPLYDVFVDVQMNSEKYTEWFKIALPNVMAEFKLRLA